MKTHIPVQLPVQLAPQNFSNERHKFAQPEVSNLSVHFSSATDEWATPQWLFDALNKEFGFTLDVCITHQNAKCRRHFTREENGLIASWAGEICWINPPYGTAIKHWMGKAHESAAQDGATVVCLVPARTDTAW